MKKAPATSSASPRRSPAGSPASVTPAVSAPRRPAARSLAPYHPRRPDPRPSGAHQATGTGQGARTAAHPRTVWQMERPEEEVASRPADAAAPDDVGVAGEGGLDGRDVYWFVGGPLDGRVHTRAPDDPAPPVVRHTHLHDGPKIVHLYDLHEVAGHGGEYRLRTS